MHILSTFLNFLKMSFVASLVSLRKKNIMSFHFMKNAYKHSSSFHQIRHDNDFLNMSNLKKISKFDVFGILWNINIFYKFLNFIKSMRMGICCLFILLAIKIIFKNAHIVKISIFILNWAFVASLVNLRKQNYDF